MTDAEATHSSYSWRRDPLLWAYSVLMFLPIILVFVFYNYLGLELLVYGGWIVLVFSVVIIFLAGGEFRRRGGAPRGKSVVTRASVLSFFVGSALFYRDVLREEQMSVEKFGDGYRRSMKRVPRLNVFVGILRLLRRRRGE